MARKDRIFRSFLEHKSLKEKYGLTENDLKTDLSQALVSEVPAIRTIAMIVDALEGPNPVSDSVLRNMITQYLDSAAI